MSEASMRVHCPWCTTRLSAQAAVCHRCGAIKKRRPLSMLKLFFLHPLIASVVALAAFSLPFIDLSIVKAAGVFAGVWVVLSAIHIALRQRRFWVQLEPLLLQEDEGEEQIEHKSPFTVSPAWATAATVLIGVGAVWATAPEMVMERAPEATLPVAQSTRAPTTPVAAAPATSPTTAPAPVNVATVAPPGEALPPTPSAQPWKPETASAMTTAAVEPPKPEAPPAPDRTLVLTAQRLLSDLGYDVGGIDGRIGSRTRAALKTFREKTGLNSDEINAGLIAALESAAASGQTNTAAAAPAEPRSTRSAESRPARVPEPLRAETVALSNSESRASEPVRQTETLPLPRRTEPRMTDSAPAQPRAAEPVRLVDPSLATASLNREQSDRPRPAPAPRSAPPAPASQVPMPQAHIPGMIPMTPRSSRQPAQQAEVPPPPPSIGVTPKTVPIHTLVPTIPAPASAMVDPSAGAPARESQTPVRLGPPVRLHY